MISQVKDLALELGRTPSKREYCAKYGASGFRAFNEQWSLVINAAGLDPYRANSKKIDNSIFSVSIERHLDNFVPSPVKERGPYPTIALLSDVHLPFHCQRVIDKFYEYCRKNKPEWIIFNGDIWDMYSHSRFPRSHNIFTPREERDMCRKLNEKMWEELVKASPNSKRRQLLGNHSVRPMKQILEVYPEAEDWITEGLQKDLTFKDVVTIFDPREELIIDDIVIHHGFRSHLGAHRDYALMNCAVGHTHKGGTVYRHIQGKTIWELNSGYAGDPEGKGLTYRPQKITDWTQGFGVIREDGPAFISC